MALHRRVVRGGENSRVIGARVIVRVVKPDLAARLRKEYEAEGLVEGEMFDDPLEQFGQWFEGVLESELDEPNTFVLATADSEGRPSARAVLMKELSDDGVVFYTDLESRKSAEIKSNPYAAATFVWTALHRQARFEGEVRPVSEEVADAYFSGRPRGAQIAAHASNQSREVESREVLVARFEKLDAAFDDIVPRPDTWGGWRLVPETVEFWQGRPNRFHDRIRYRRDESGWSRVRLAP